MKKIILTLLLIVSFASTYGQSKWHKQQNEVFVEAAAKEYNLDDAQKEKLYDARMKMMMSYKESNQAVENGEITKEEKQAKNHEISANFNAELSKITGKSFKEMKPWLQKMREEMKKK